METTNPTLNVISEKEKFETNERISKDNVSIAKDGLETARTQLEIAKVNAEAYSKSQIPIADAVKTWNKTKVLMWLAIGVEVLEFAIHIINSYF